MSPLTPEELEQRIHRTLRDLPLHPAPDSLEDRVLAAIAARQARPWWRQGFATWPRPARTAFLVVSATFAGLVAAAGLLQPPDLLALGPVEVALERLAALRSAGAVLADTAGGLMPSVSTTWIYAGLAVFAAFYAALFGLGAAAYRLFWRHR